MPGMGQDKRIPNALSRAVTDVLLKGIGGQGQRLCRETPLRSFFEPWGKIGWDGRKDKAGACEALLGSVNMREVNQFCAARYFVGGLTTLRIHPGAGHIL